MPDNGQRIQDVVSEAVSLVPALMDGDISAKDRMRLIRLFFDIAEIALDMYEKNNDVDEVSVSHTTLNDKAED